MPKETEISKFGVKIIPIKWADKIANKHNLLGFCLESRLRKTLVRMRGDLTNQEQFLEDSTSYQKRNDTKIQ